MAKTKRGRPAGRKTEEPTVVEVTASRCRCGSTDRAPYYGVREMAYNGITPSGDPHTHVVWRRTRCRACGQTRVDKTFENRGQ